MVPAAFPHQVLIFRKSEKLKLSEKNEYFHSGISKNWTHDLPIDKGAFEGGNLDDKRAYEHNLLSVWSRKSGYFRDIAVFSLKWGGEFRFFLPMPPRGRRRGPTPMEQTLPQVKRKLLCPLFHFEIFNISGDTNLFIKARHPRLGAPYRAPGAPEGVDPHSTNYIWGTK